MRKRLSRMMNEKNMFAVLRAAAVAAGVLGTLLALWLGAVGVSAMVFMHGAGAPLGERAAAVFCFVVLAAVSSCCYAALTVFFRMCGRLARGSAFTEENARAMGAIAGLLFACGVLLLAAILVLEAAVLECVLVLPVIGLLLFMLAFLGAALLAQALALLVRRAAALQRESELTI